MLTALGEHATAQAVQTAEHATQTDAPGCSRPTDGIEAGSPEESFQVRLPSKSQLAMRMMVRKLMLDLYDLDRNHILDQEERHRLLEAAENSKREYALRLAQRFDTNRDGILDRAEEASLRAYVDERRKTQHGLPDLNREPEGSLCTVPLPPPPHRPFSQEGKYPDAAPPSHGLHPLSREAKLIAFISGHLIMAAYDTNDDGILDAEESRRLFEDGQWLYSMREKALLEAYDTDRDGRISRQELKRALRAIFFPGESSPESAHQRPPVTPMDRMLDTRFDADILLHLSETGQP